MAYQSLFTAQFSPIHVYYVEDFVVKLQNRLARHGASVTKWDFRPSDDVLTIYFPTEHREMVKSTLKWRFLLGDFKLCVLPEMTMREIAGNPLESWKECMKIETRDFVPGIALRSVWDGTVQHISWEEDCQKQTA
jgi:hypothetical protein